MRARTPDEVVALFERISGKTIRSFSVYAINSLKTLTPRPDALVGEAIGEAASTGDSTFAFGAGPYSVDVDLQRVGRVSFSEGLSPWSPGKPSMPVAQLLFADGSGLEFVEPGKTKRITFALRPTA